MDNGMEEFFKMLKSGMETQEGDKLADLNPDEIMTHDTHDMTLDDLQNQFEELNFKKKQVQLAIDKWWVDIRRAHKMQNKTRMAYRDGSIYELVPAQKD